MWVEQGDGIVLIRSDQCSVYALASTLALFFTLIWIFAVLVKAGIRSYWDFSVKIDIDGTSHSNRQQRGPHCCCLDWRTQSRSTSFRSTVWAQYLPSHLCRVTDIICPTRRTSLREELDSCAPRAAIGVPPWKAPAAWLCCHRLTRAPHGLPVQKLLEVGSFSFRRAKG